ncbi:MAG: VWA domain-containing protein [Spirochaetaceae bacterium]|nr:MAG: VWA domain-containing protein [Spirochaetaceae bacterium]
MSHQFGRNISYWSPQFLGSEAPQGNLRHVSWASLPLGVVVVDGVSINRTFPEELRDFPVVDAPLRRRLFERYHFRSDHPVTVATFHSLEAAHRLAEEIRSLDRRLRAGEPLRNDVTVERRFWSLNEKKEAGYESPRLTESTRLVKDVYNSFTVNTALPGPIPSLLGTGPSTDISLAQVVSGLLSGRPLLPKDVPLALHVALDVSFSMKDRDRIRHGIAVVNRLAAQIPAVMPGTQVRAYLFSDELCEVNAPVERIPVRSEGTKQAPVFHRVIRVADATKHNMLIVISDGEPQDLPETLRAAEKLKAAKLDYLQILLHTDDDLRHQIVGALGEFEVKDDTVTASDVPADRIITLDSDALKNVVDARFDNFTRIAETAGGNQVVMIEFSALGLVTVELYDRYVGLLSV